MDLLFGFKGSLDEPMILKQVSRRIKEQESQRNAERSAKYQ